MEEQTTQSNPEHHFERRRFQLARDFYGFLSVRKRWWLLPIVLMTLFVGILIVFGHSSAVSPFVYALF